MRRFAILAITVLVCACASDAQSLSEARQHSANGMTFFRQAKFAEAEREYRLALDYIRTLGKAGLQEYTPILRTWLPSSNRKESSKKPAAHWRNVCRWKSILFHSRAV